MNKLMRVRAALMAACLIGSPVFAYQCQGTIVEVSLNPSGVLTVHSPAGGLNWAYVCQMGVTYNNGVGNEACKAIYASLLAAQMSGKQVMWHYNDALSCSTRPSWAVHSGWYYGPTVLNY